MSMKSKDTSRVRAPTKYDENEHDSSVAHKKLLHFGFYIKIEDGM